MADGARISAAFGSQVSKPGCAIAIRRFPQRPYTITDMIRNSTMISTMAAYLWTLLDAKAVGLVIGVTGSGKTTLLSSLVSMMNPRWRILTIEDTLELRIPHMDWVRLNTRRSYGMAGEEFDATVRNLIDVSLTQRPDYEIVGETRLFDMDALFQSVGTGHGGLTSFHASTPYGALARMRGGGIGDGELALLWFVAHSARVRRGGSYHRKVTDISEVIPDNAGESAYPTYSGTMLYPTNSSVRTCTNRTGTWKRCGCAAYRTPYMTWSGASRCWTCACGGIRTRQMGCSGCWAGITGRHIVQGGANPHATSLPIYARYSVCLGFRPWRGLQLAVGLCPRAGSALGHSGTARSLVPAWFLRTAKLQDGAACPAGRRISGSIQNPSLY